MHAVGDVEQRQPLLAQALQHVEDLRDVGGGERGSRLVEDEDARLAGERLGDLDHLPPRQRQVLDQRERMDVGRSGTRQRLLGDGALLLAVDHAEALRRVADDDIVGDRKVRDERQFLEDANDAGIVGSRRRSEGYLLAVEYHLALVRLDDARHDLDERRFAGAVLAEDAVDLPGIDGQLSAIERAHAAITLRDALHPEKRTGPAHSFLPAHSDGAVESIPRRRSKLRQFTGFPSSGP